MKRFRIHADTQGMRLSRFVQRVSTGLPTSALHKAFRNRRIKVNGRRATPDTLLAAGDIVELYLNDEFFPAQPAAVPDTPGAPFTVVWQNPNIAVLYKPAGVLSHSDNTGDATLLGSFTRMLADSGEYTPGGPFAPALCNRLDRGTEGLVLAAKNHTALRDANTLIRDGELEKVYRCIVVGLPPEGIHTAFHCRDRQAKRVRVSKQHFADCKQISTGIHVLEQRGRFSLCEVGLYTGRTHQIRAHLALLGAPVLGDDKYGDRAENLAQGVHRQALCAWQLGFKATLPTGNVLCRLAGQTFTCYEQAAISGQWAGLSI